MRGSPTGDDLASRCARAHGRHSGLAGLTPAVGWRGLLTRHAAAAVALAGLPLQIGQICRLLVGDPNAALAAFAARPCLLAKAAPSVAPQLSHVVRRPCRYA